MRVEVQVRNSSQQERGAAYRQIPNRTESGWPAKRSSGLIHQLPYFAWGSVRQPCIQCVRTYSPAVANLEAWKLAAFDEPVNRASMDT